MRRFRLCSRMIGRIRAMRAVSTERPLSRALHSARARKKILRSIVVAMAASAAGTARSAPWVIKVSDSRSVMTFSL